MIRSEEKVIKLNKLFLVLLIIVVLIYSAFFLWCNSILLKFPRESIFFLLNDPHIVIFSDYFSVLFSIGYFFYWLFLEHFYSKHKELISKLKINFILISRIIMGFFFGVIGYVILNS